MFKTISRILPVNQGGIYLLSWTKISVLIQVCFCGSNTQNVSINSDKGLALHSQKAISWTNVYKDLWRIKASPGHSEFYNFLHFCEVQLSAIIMRSVFWKILMKDTP